MEVYEGDDDDQEDDDEETWPSTYKDVNEVDDDNDDNNGELQFSPSLTDTHIHTRVLK